MIESVELVVQKEGAPDRVLDLTPGTVRIGRADDNELVLADISVSRRHARLVYDNQCIKIEDLGSGNGTYFRGSQVQEHALDDGDTVVIDPFVLKFRIQKQNAAPIIHDARGPRLLVTASDVLGPEAFVIPDGGATMGRSDECVIVLPDAAASRVHARVVETPGGYQILDENSANGVFVNGERIQSHWLKDGDEVRVGDTFFQFQDFRMEQAHSITDQQLNLSEMGEETSWSKELTLPDPDNRLVTDPGQSDTSKSPGMMGVAVAVAVVILLVLVIVLLILLVSLGVMMMNMQSTASLWIHDVGNPVSFFVS